MLRILTETEQTNWLNNADNKKFTAHYRKAMELKTLIENILAEDNHGTPKIASATKDAALKLNKNLTDAINEWKKDIFDNVKIIEPDSTQEHGSLLNNFVAMSKQVVSKYKSKDESKSPYDINELSIHFINENLLNDCKKAIKEQKSLLMADDGFWEQIKFKINEFLKIFNIDPLLNYKGTLFNEHQEVNEKIENLEQAKNQSNEP